MVTTSLTRPIVKLIKLLTEPELDAFYQKLPKDGPTATTTSEKKIKIKKNKQTIFLPLTSL